MKLELRGEEAMESFGACLASVCAAGLQIHLRGDLGAGKTTLTRGFLRGLGHEGTVKSPTYTLVEPYELQGRSLFHLDLYRLGDPEELEWIGIRDLADSDATCLVEWPEQGRGFLPPADLVIRIEHRAGGRGLVLEAGSPAGEALLADLAEADCCPA